MMIIIKMEMENQKKKGAEAGERETGNALVEA